MKFGRSWSWASWFGEQLADAGGDGGAGGDGATVICPVPMHWSRRWQRGYNQAHLIAAAMAKQLSTPCCDLLIRTRSTPPQTDIPHTRRRENVAGAIAAKEVYLNGCDVLLVDDVKTTGATLSACVAQLHECGAKHVRAAVVAVAHPSGGDFTRV